LSGLNEKLKVEPVDIYLEELHLGLVRGIDAMPLIGGKSFIAEDAKPRFTFSDPVKETRTESGKQKVHYRLL